MSDKRWPLTRPVEGCGCGECRAAWQLMLNHQRRKELLTKPFRDEYQRLLNKLDERT